MNKIKSKKPLKYQHVKLKIIFGNGHIESSSMLGMGVSRIVLLGGH